MWSDAMNACDAAVAGVFDEIDVTAQARRQGVSVNDLGTDDEARQSFAFKASISLAPPVTGRGDLYDPGTARGGLVSYAAVLTANSADWPWMPVRDDLLAANGIQYLIVATDRHGTDRYVAYLNKAR